MASNPMFLWARSANIPLEMLSKICLSKIAMYCFKKGIIQQMYHWSSIQGTKYEYINFIKLQHKFSCLFLSSKSVYGLALVTCPTNTRGPRLSTKLSSSVTTASTPSPSFFAAARENSQKSGQVPRIGLVRLEATCHLLQSILTQ